MRKELRRLSSIEGRIEKLEAGVSELAELAREAPARELAAMGRLARVLGAGAYAEEAPGPVGEPSLALPLDDQLGKLRELCPEAFPIWEKLFDRGARYYHEDPATSCSTRSNAYAEAFRGFVSLWGRGRILDVGCGIQGRPSYLEGLDASRLAGIEPLPMVVQPDFPVVQALGEFLPWPDASFETVLSATSLDHLLHLGRAMDETERVLVEGGRLLLWIASVRGARPWSPTCEEPVDDFHMFHVDVAWFEPWMQERFRLVEREVFPVPSFDHVFYCFEPREGLRAKTRSGA